MSDPRMLNRRELEEEADSDYVDESESSSEDMNESTRTFERIVSVEDTPWGEFFMSVGRLSLWLTACLFMQMLWSVQLKSYIDLAYLPVSIILVPVAFWWLRGKSFLSAHRLDGLQSILLFAFHRWLGARDPAKTLGDQLEAASADNRKRGRMGYNVGLLSCITMFWTLLVGQSCWPFGYMYLCHYTFVRCQSLCEQVNVSIPVADTASPRNASETSQLTIQGRSPQLRTDLIGTCSERFGFAANKAYPSEAWRRWSDPHWPIRPQGAWVVGQPLHGLHVHYSAREGYGAVNATDCSRLYMNTTILVITLLLVLAVAATTFLSRQSLVLSSVSVVLAVLCVTGMGKVWMGAIRCRSSTLNSPDLVFSHLLHSCISVATYNGTVFGSSMLAAGHRFTAYESNFRHFHQIARSEASVGCFSEVFSLLLVIAAHTTFRCKRMQTCEARFHILSRRPYLFRCMLHHWDFLNSLPNKARTSMAWTLHRVYKLHEGKSQHLQQCMDSLMASAPSADDLDESLSSFWPAMLYSFVRALIPSMFRQFLPFHGIIPALPEYNTLWMLNAVSVVLMNIVVYLFVLYQVQEATRRYSSCIQTWLLFERAWNFPSQASLAGDALIETVQVQVQDDEEVVEMLDRSSNLLGDFSCDGDGLVNMQAVREVLPTWWAWREYLIIDYTDKRVRLEFHLVVVFAMLLMSIGQLCLDYHKDGFVAPQLLDADATIKWLDRHLSPFALQTAWDILFLAVPLLHAIHCASVMNRMIESQLKKVVHLEELIGQDLGDGGSDTASSLARADLGAQVRNIFSMSKSELAKGGPATKLLSTFTINKEMFAIVGTVLSIFGGGQAVEIFQTLGGEGE